MSKVVRNLLQRIIIFGLLTIIGFLGYNTVNNLNRTTNINKQIEQVKVEAKQEIEDLNMEQEILNNNLKECAKLQVATGSIDMEYKFTNRVAEIDNCDKFSPFATLKQTLTHRDFLYKANYKYNYKYDLNKINTKIEDNNIIITLRGGDLLLEDVSETKDSVSILEDTGVFANRLNSNETIAMASLCRLKVYNYLITDTDLQQNALNSLQKGIETMCKNLKIKSYKINIINNKTLTNKDSYMTINHQEQNNKINFLK